MNITSIEKPNRRCQQWSGTASEGNKRYHWFYTPRYRLSFMEQDETIPNCWMNVETTPTAKATVLRAVRRAKRLKVIA